MLYNEIKLPGYHLNWQTGWQWAPASIPLSTLGIIAVTIAIHLLRRKNIKGWFWVALSLLGGSVWVFGQTISINRIPLTDKIFWHQFEFFGNLLSTYTYTFFALEYAGRKKAINRKTLLAAAVIPISILILVLTNNQHHLLISHYEYDTYANSSEIYTVQGPLFWLFIVYNIGIMLLGALILLRSPRHILEQYNRQIHRIILLSVLPLSVGLIDFYIDLIPFVHSGGIAMLIASMLVYRILSVQHTQDTLTKAFQNAINLFREPYILTDNANKIIDLNKAALVLTQKTLNELIGIPLQEAWAELYLQIHNAIENPGEAEQVLLKIGEQVREYQAIVSTVQDAENDGENYSIVLTQSTPDINEKRALLSSNIELRNYQYITETLLNISSLPEVMEQVASAIVANFGFQSAFIASCNPQTRTLRGLACFPNQNQKLVRKLQPLFHAFRLPLDWRELVLSLDDRQSPAIERVLSGESIFSPELHALLSPWLERETSDLIQEMLGIGQVGGIPLRSAGETRGIIFVTSQQKTILPRQKNAVNRISNLAAIALENAHLYQQAREQARRQASLRQALEIFVSSLNKHEIYENLAEHLCDTFKASSVHIYSFDSERNKASLAAQVLAADAPGQESLSASEDAFLSAHPAYQRFLDTGEPCTIHAENARLTGEDQQAMLEHGVKSILLLPLNSRQEAMGIIQIWESRIRREFTPEEISMGETIADQAAIALDNAILYSQAMQEIAERKETETLLKQSEQDYRRLFENAHDAIILFDPKTEIILDVNQRACEMYKLPRNEFIDRSLQSFTINADKEEKHIQEILLKGSFRKFETIHRINDGSFLHLEINASVVEYHGKKAIISINRDITERKAFEEKLRFAAVHDELTQLPNRTLFLERLKHSIQRKSHDKSTLFAVLFLDLDNFKNINDTFGHKTGDKFLIQISKRLLESVRQLDTVARFGGDEFAILLESIDYINDIYDICSRILRSVSRPITVDKQELFATTSIGIVVANPHYVTPEDMLRDADIAMYRAKGSGGNHFEFFNEEMRRHFLLTLELEKSFSKSIQENDFILYYQPAYNLSANRIFGLEALVRWKHPEHGLLLPENFLPATGKNKLSIRVDGVVCSQACRQVREWKTNDSWNSSWSLLINISSHQLLTPEFIGHIESIMENTPLEPSKIILELPENALIEKPELAGKIIHHLRTIGFRVFLDDFGKELSSFSLLSKIPVNAIKIHDSFIQNIGAPNIPQLLQSMVDTGHNLGLLVACKGIETAEQLAFAKKIGCDYAQGNFLQEPVPSDQLTSFFSGENQTLVE